MITVNEAKRAVIDDARKAPVRDDGEKEKLEISNLIKEGKTAEALEKLLAII